MATRIGNAPAGGPAASEARARLAWSGAGTATEWEATFCLAPDWRGVRRLGDEVRSGASWLEAYVHPADRRRVGQAIKTAIASKSVFEAEHRLRDADGGYRWVYSRAVPLLGDDGEIAEWLCASTSLPSDADDAGLSAGTSNVGERVDIVAARAE